MDRPAWRYALAISLAVVIAAVLILALFELAPSGSQGREAFNGVALSITYVGSSVGIYGPVHQNACLQEPLLSPEGPLGPSCPNNLTAGTEYNFTIFELFVPYDLDSHSISEMFLNVTISSPIALSQTVCGVAQSSPPTQRSSLGLELPPGIGCAWTISFVAPSPLPATLPGVGIWMAATMSVDAV